MCILQLTLTRGVERFGKISLISLHFQRDYFRSNDIKPFMSLCVPIKFHITYVHYWICERYEQSFSLSTE